MAKNQENALSRREAFLRTKYGELLTLEEIAQVLRYRTVGAARRAYNRGKFPIPLKRFPDRQGYFATVKTVAEFLSSLDTLSEKEDTKMK